MVSILAHFPRLVPWEPSDDSVTATGMGSLMPAASQLFEHEQAVG